MSDTQIIQKIRTQTGAGIMDIKKAVEEANGDENKALEILKKTGQKIAAKKQAERVTKDGIIGSYIHANGKAASLIILSCETDFVSKGEDFKELAHDIAMQVAAMNPIYISEADVPEDIIAKEKEIQAEILAKEGKPAEIQEKIIEGKINKFYKEVCLLNQAYIKDDKKTIQDLINEATARMGEKIEVKKMVKFEI